MILRNDLGKLYRLSDVRLVAADAEHGRIELYGLYRTGIFSMLRQRTMACLAIHVRMPAFVFYVQDLRMAVFAGLMTGKRNRLSLDFQNGIAAEMSVFPEAARHQHVAHHEKHDEANHEYGRQTEEMSCVFDVHS